MNPTTRTTTAPAAPSATPALLFVLCCAMGVGPLMNYGMSAVGPVILHDLAISESQFGLLATATFVSAALSSGWLGRLSDRVSQRAQMILIFGGAAFTLGLAALSYHYAVLLAAALLAGPSQAISNPTTNHLIIHEVPPQRRAGWIGIKQSGVQACQFFSGLFFPAVAVWAGWHGAFALAAVIAVALLLYALAHLPPPRVAAKAAVAGTDSRAAGAAVKSPFPVSVRIFAGFSLLSGLCLQATNIYLPLFAVRELHFSLVAGGATMGFAGAIGVASRILWGRQMARGLRASTLLLVLGGGALLGALALLLAGQLDMPALLWFAVVLHGATVMGANVVVMAGVMDVVPAPRIGAATGVVARSMYAGFGIGPVLLGVLLEHTGSFHTGWIMVGVGYLACIAMALLLRRHGRRRRGE